MVPSLAPLPTSHLTLHSDLKNKIVYLSCHLGAKTTGELSRMRVFAVHSFLWGEANSQDMEHGGTVGWTHDLVTD